MRLPRPEELKNTERFDLKAAIDNNDAPPSRRDIGPEKAGKALDLQSTTAVVREEQFDPERAEIDEIRNSDHPVSPANVEAIPAEQVLCFDDDVFDKLSKTLAEHASQLAKEEKQKEQALRGQVVHSLRNFKTDRSSLGKSLSEYKTVFKTQRQWVRVAKVIGSVIEVSSRTVFRMIDDYESSLNGPRSSATLDTTAIHGEKLSRRERDEIHARLAIRAMLNDVPVNQKAAALAELLAEEAFQVWGKREKFSIVVTPKQSRFTIDGRKRGPRQTADEVAA